MLGRMGLAVPIALGVAVARGSGLTQSAWVADESAFEEMIDRALKEDGLGRSAVGSTTTSR